jgi:5-methyltetrahydropteroyltriglutamate--homocysteine methyltransferase
MQKSTFATTTLGYPRVGQGRAYKWMLEDFWAGKTGRETLQNQALQRENECWQIQREVGINCISAGDFSLYDHVLDTSIMLGCIPERYGWDGGAITPQYILRWRAAPMASPRAR